MLLKFIVILSICVVISAVKLPKFFKKCRKTDPNLEKCTVESGNAAMVELAQGVKQLRFPPLRPLEVPFIRIDIGNSLELNMTNCKVSGIDKLRIENVHVDLSGQKYEFYIFTPRLEHLATYDINGRILILPIQGHGPMNATFLNSKIKYSFDFDLVERNGKSYMVPKNYKYTYTTDRAYFHLDNLFNGNEILGREMNKFLDENWKEVNTEIGTRLGDVIGELLTEILKGFMSRVPFEEMYINDDVE